MTRNREQASASSLSIRWACLVQVSDQACMRRFSVGDPKNWVGGWVGGRVARVVVL